MKIDEGKRISDDELKCLDRARMVVAIAGPPKAPEVDGQCLIGLFSCPWCGQTTRVVASPGNSTWYTCGFCGGAFRA